MPRFPVSALFCPSRAQGQGRSPLGHKGALPCSGAQQGISYAQETCSSRLYSALTATIRDSNPQAEVQVASLRAQPSKQGPCFVQKWNVRECCINYIHIGIIYRTRYRLEAKDMFSGHDTMTQSSHLSVKSTPKTAFSTLEPRRGPRSSRPSPPSPDSPNFSLIGHEADVRKTWRLKGHVTPTASHGLDWWKRNMLLVSFCKLRVS